MTPKRPKVTCLGCGGSGRVSFATETTECAACGGKGTVDVAEQTSQDRG